MPHAQPTNRAYATRTKIPFINSEKPCGCKQFAHKYQGLVGFTRVKAGLGFRITVQGQGQGQFSLTGQQQQQCGWCVSPSCDHRASVLRTQQLVSVLSRHDGRVRNINLYHSVCKIKSISVHKQTTATKLPIFSALDDILIRERNISEEYKLNYHLMHTVNSTREATGLFPLQTLVSRACFEAHTYHVHRCTRYTGHRATTGPHTVFPSPSFHFTPRLLVMGGTQNVVHTPRYYRERVPRNRVYRGTCFVIAVTNSSMTLHRYVK